MVKHVSSSVPEPDGDDDFTAPSGDALDRSMKMLKIPVNGDTHSCLLSIARERSTTVAAIVRGLITPLVRAWREARESKGKGKKAA